eukprot:scaffold2710_cov168-Skeletonema_marinoi.AAC.8
MSSFLELSSPSMEERIDEGAAAATHLVPNDVGTGTATRNEELERHGPIHDAPMGGEYSNHNDHLRDGYVEDNYDNAMNINNTNQTEKQRAWIQKQKQTINEEDAAQHNLQKEQPIHVDDETEVPQSYGCTDIPLPDPERMDDAAAISVMVYLLVIAFLLAMAILIGTVVVSQYGFIVLVAVIIAVGAMLLVFLVVMSVIQGDRKLTKARSQIHKWSMEVKEVIMKEIADLKEDVADYSSGMLLLTYEGELDTTTSDYVRDDFDNKENKSKRRRKPKSMIFKLAISPLKKLTRKNQKGSNSSGKKRSWFGKKKKTTTVDNDEEGPSANYYVPPSENFEVV